MLFIRLKTEKDIDYVTFKPIEGKNWNKENLKYPKEVRRERMIN